ncbi:hypothetical protein Hanom_Chr07g00676581 [Helianthus anomalus]
MNTTKGKTPKSLQFKPQHETTNNGVDESFRVLYYASAAAGSVPFMWESQPGTPKHALTESSLPPLTPPPSYHQCSQNYNSSKRSGFLHNILFASSRKKTEVRRVMSVVKFGLEEGCGEPEHAGGGSPASGGFKRSYRVNKMKKAIQWFVRHGK